MENLTKTLWAVALKTLLPATLGSLGTIAAVTYADGFRAFCGV